jgi:sugar phosphate isomerase/epimerase
MKLSNFSDHFLKRGHNLETIISKTADMGFEGIDIGICLPAENDLLAISRWDTDKAYRKKILELCKSKGLEIPCIVGYNDFLTPGDGYAQREYFICKHAIEVAADMNVKFIRTHINSLVGYAHYPDLQRIAPRAQARRGVELLKKYVKMAEDAGMVLLLDNHFFFTVLEHLAIVKKMNSSSLKLSIDVGNLVGHGEDLLSTVRECKDFLVHFHVKGPSVMGSDPLPGFRGIRWGGESGEIGAGNLINWEAFLKELKKINYKGYLAIEGAVWEGKERGAKYLRKIAGKVGF